VTTGDAADGQWLITAGLAAGDQVIVSGLQKVQDGAPAKPTPWKPEAASAAAKGPEAAPAASQH
jgi:membrane fusion protein (multidrug efflux system)